MKIEKITICNLTSIAGEQVVDFTCEPLKSAGLFAITGDTGAGKSTILDAICLALYDEAPRLTGVEKSDRNVVQLEPAREDGVKPLQPDNTRNILRRGASEGYAVVEFSVPDGSLYRAKWYVRLKRTRNYDDVVRTLERLSPRREVFDSKKIQPLLNEIIGLDYSQFSRTVMLAQGSFSNFIKARREEKSALLEKLTGTEIYRDISMNIYRLTAEARKGWDELESELRGIRHDRLEEEELAVVREEKMRLETSLDHLQKALETVARQMDWFEEFERLKLALRECEERNNAARKNYEALRGDELRLERYDSVLCVQPVYQEIVQRQKDVETSRRQEEDTAKEIEKSRHGLAKSDNALGVAQEQVAEVEKHFQLRQPDINRGYTLNGEIREARAQLGNWEKQLAEAQEVLVHSRAALSEEQERLSAVRKEIEGHSLHKQAIAVHKRMFDKYDTVKDKLSALGTEQKSHEDYQKQLVSRRKQQESLLVAFGRQEKILLDCQDRLNTLKSELLIHHQANRGYDGAELQLHFATSSRRFQLLQGARSLWARISAAYEEIGEKKAACSRHAADLQQLSKELERVQREWEVLEAAYRRLNVSYTLSQSQDIINLRQQLQEGTACPVCGAMHHPYHTETEREMGKLLSNLEKEYTEMGEELSAKTATLSALREKQAADQAALDAERRSLAETERYQAENVEQWAEYADLDASFYDCSASANREARRVMIGQLLESTARAVEDAERDWKTFNDHQEKINALNKDITKVSGLMDEARTSLEKLRMEDGIAAAAVEELQKNIDHSDRAIRQFYADLNDILTISGWSGEWERDPDGFRSRLSSLYNDWQNTCASLDACSHKEILLQKDLKSAEKKVAEDNQSLADHREKRDALSESLAVKMQEFRKLFGESSPEQEAEAFRMELSRAREAEKMARGAREEATALLHLYEGRLRNLQETRRSNEALLRQKKMELDTWMLRYNGEHSPLQFSELARIFSDGCDWNALRRELNARRSDSELARHQLQVAQMDLRQWQSRPERPASEQNESRETLRIESESLAGKIKEQTRMLAIADDKLRSHERCERNAAAMQEKVDAARENAEQWRRLCDLFGSADGKRFRNLAQSYTFKSLVDHANRQLRMLCSRYELRNIPGSLDLELIDREMFDQRRYVHSLSGGETFVVSLALALGLSALSGDNLHIGSLFIDEGFGNLDRESLDMVMNALANLENSQGRKVGVISHTEQIQMQISPQVHVVKLASGGRSKIEIV